MIRSKFGHTSPTVRASLAAYQATADRQARRWFAAEISSAIRGGAYADYVARQNDRRESWLGWHR